MEPVEANNASLDEENGIRTFWSGLAIVVAVTAISVTIWYFTRGSFTLLFWGLYLVGGFVALKGAYVGLRSSGSPPRFFRRLVLFVGAAGVAVATVYFVSIETFAATPPPEDTIGWDGSEATMQNASRREVLFQGDVANITADWTMLEVAVAITPEDAQGRLMYGDKFTILLLPLPSTLEPGESRQYSREATLPLEARSYAEEVTWEWRKQWP